MGPLLKWLMKDRRRRFVRDHSESFVVDVAAVDAGVAVISASGVDNSASQYCDSSSATFSSDSSACSAPSDTSSSTTF